MGRLPRLLVLLATATVLGSGAAGAGEQDRELPPGSLAAYLRLASRCRAGDVSAIRELRGWHFLDVERAVAALAHAKDRLSEVPGTGWIDVRTAEAAVLMHVTAALDAIRERSAAEGEEHVRSAITVLEAIHAAAGRRQPGTPPLLTRIDRLSFYAGLSAGCLSLGDLGLADDLATQGLRHHPTDPQLLYVGGCVKEALAVVHAAYGRSGEVQQTRREAEKLLRDALAVAPDHSDARLHLARVLLQEDRLVEAQPQLEAVCRASDARVRYLGWLFLGELQQRRRGWNEAAASYAKAMREEPDNQAARLGLAYVLEQQSGPAAARPLVLATLALSGRLDRRGDPWWTYPIGPYEFAAETLDTLQKRVMAP